MRIACGSFFLALAVHLVIQVSPAQAKPEAQKKSHEKIVDDLELKLSMARSELRVRNTKLTCDGDGDCEVLEFGFRHCGGPSTYLIVSRLNPDFASVQSKTEEITRLEKELGTINPPMECTASPKLPQARCLKQRCEDSAKSAPANPN